MINVLEITIEEFEQDIYDKFITLFPKDEIRKWDSIRILYKRGIEKFYKIMIDNNTIGFFLLEKINNYPYYLDYFAIYNEYQSKGYGSLSINKLLKDVVKDKGLIGEIEKLNEENPITIRRFKFYEKLGFKLIDSEYYLYNVYYNPIVYLNTFDKKEIDKMFIEYYKINVGDDDFNEHFKIIK